MLTPNRILLASDFSASAEAALHYAAAMARQSQASLMVMHVIETGLSAFRPWTDMFRSSEVLAKREAERVSTLERLMQHPALQGVSTERVIQHGNAIDHITDMASQADLVVMGMGTPGASGGRLHGNVARHIAHASPVPVLLLPVDGGTASLPAVTDSTLAFQNVLLAINLAGYAPQAVEMALVIATACKAALLALQVVEPANASTYPVDAGEGLHHNADGLKILLEKRLADIVPEANEAPPRQRRVQIGQAIDTLLQHMESNRADLVVMSAHRYGALHKFFALSTIDAVLARAMCPLLAIPIPRSSKR